MGFLEKLFKGKSFNSEQNQKNVQTSEINMSKWYTVEYQRNILEKISNVIPTVMIGGAPMLCVDYHLNRVDSNDIFGVLNAIGAITLDLNQTLGMTNFEKADVFFKDKPKDELRFCIDALSKYSTVVKPEFAINIKSTIKIMEGYLKNE